PSPRAGEVLVRQVATSVNPADAKIRARGPALGPALPGVLGVDVAGIVVAVGEGVTGFRVGDAVYGAAGGVRDMPGACAEYIAADARLLAPAPRTIALRDAAALPLVAITAWEGLVDRARIAPGARVLVLGGTGGVGHVAVQIAKARGAWVAATVSSPEKAATARALGADATIDYRTESLEERVAELTGGRGFDVVFDTTGGRDLAPAFAAARRNGQVIAIVSTFEADLTPMHHKGLTLHVVFMLIPMLHDEGRAHHGEILREVAALVDAGALRPLLDPSRHALAQLGAAHARLEGGGVVGKLVVDIAPDPRA
ncbi:MAG TPA: zinc-binding dehydrogenase, partial [Xanthomonadales bacterium]|nr:zinc-binding dehydrogenase [Xanthomonadales bacterium]